MTLLWSAACSGNGASTTTTRSTPSGTAEQPPSTSAGPTETTSSLDPDPTETAGVLLAGAASRSVLPTVDDQRLFLADAPGWDDLDPDDPGVFVPVWDQGRVDVGNGAGDARWVHDDLRATALALQLGDERVVLATADVYMIFALDAAEIERQARAMLAAEAARDPDLAAWAESAEFLVAATHNHHGPDTAFSVNPDWYALFAEEMAAAMATAVTLLQPAELHVASGRHGFGVNDVRDPVVMDDRLNVLTATSAETGDVLATVVQWNSHPEVTLGWTPPAEPDAEGRYFTADYPGVLRERVQAELGGEVLFFNGALGNQVGPGRAPAWLVTDQHPVGDGYVVPEGAAPVAGCEEHLCRNLAKTEAIGTQLAVAVLDLAAGAEPVDIHGITVREQAFYTRLTNIGFRLLIAEGGIGWQPAQLFTCTAPRSDATCEDDGGELVSDPVLDALVGSQIRAGDVVRTSLVHLSLGDVGFLFLPGELPPELVVGVPADFDEAPGLYYRTPERHAVGAAYDFPGYLLDLVDESITFTVGLGGDELGYWVPVADYRLRCLDIVLPNGVTCAELFAGGHLEHEDAVAGSTCQRLWSDLAALGAYPEGVGAAVEAVCRYGQALGRELGEPPGRYEETNAAGWDLVDDTWAAAVELFGRDGTGRVNPTLPTGGWLARLT